MNNLLEFVNYDSELVANQLMPKKLKQSWQSINVLPKDCCVRIGDLEATGDFYITYLKGFKNPLDEKILNYLEISSTMTSENYENIVKDLVDKQIKVSSNDIRLSIGGNQIGKI